MSELLNEQLESALEKAIDYVPPPPEDTQNRFGMSMLINIPLYKHASGNLAFIDAQIRDENGIVIVNTMYYPRLMLLPFKNLTREIPPESKAGYVRSGTYENFNKAFNPDIIGSEDDLILEITKSAKQCADICENAYRDKGFRVYNTLTNVESYKQAKALLTAVLPLDNKKIFPDESRRVITTTFKGVFLDRILNFLQSDACLDRIDKLPVDETQRAKIMALYDEILDHALAANDIAVGQINESEAQIAATPQEKKGYDRSDSRFVGSPEPLDLLCLAMTNQKPKDERALEQARSLQEDNTNAMAQAANAMVEAASKMNQPQVTPGMSAEDIKKMIDEGVKAGIAAEKAKTKKTETA